MDSFHPQDAFYLGAWSSSFHLKLVLALILHSFAIPDPISIIKPYLIPELI
jgi:nitrate reductase gamma subunit